MNMTSEFTQIFQNKKGLLQTSLTNFMKKRVKTGNNLGA